MIESLFPLGTQHYLVAGAIIGLAVSLLYCCAGLIGGTSTVFSSVWSYVSPEPWLQRPDFRQSRDWRLLYAAGLIIGAALWRYGLDNPVPVTCIPLSHLVIGGFIAGFGARIGNGCAAGHPRSGLLRRTTWLGRRRPGRAK